MAAACPLGGDTSADIPDGHDSARHCSDWARSRNDAVFEVAFGLAGGQSQDPCRDLSGLVNAPTQTLEFAKLGLRATRRHARFDYGEPVGSLVRNRAPMNASAVSIEMEHGGPGTIQDGSFHTGRKRQRWWPINSCRRHARLGDRVRAGLLRFVVRAHAASASPIRWHRTSLLFRSRGS